MTTDHTAGSQPAAHDRCERRRDAVAEACDGRLTAGIHHGAEGERLIMRVAVDLNRCQGYAQCVFLAPDAFELRGIEAVHYDPNPDDAERVRVLRAAAACPVQAILVEHLGEAEARAAA
jgi:ferredoxin